MKIVVGQGSCGIATGAKKTAAEFEKQLKANNLDTELTITGCVGTCYLEPIVDVYEDNGDLTRYVKVTAVLSTLRTSTSIWLLTVTRLSKKSSLP